ncbi:MAG: PQQ-binding-like beta-propeller repeat protein [Planctomycetes bacterium]|nr:PQQ-binding-like beta-propeller repeat protein [Planctomycetota bacterium]
MLPRCPCPWSVLFVGVAAVPALGGPGKIYWADPTASTVRMASLDGTGVVELAGDPVGLSFNLDVPALGGRMYWVDVEDGVIRSADLDGANPAVVNTDPLYRPFAALAVEPSSGTLFWSATYGPGFGNNKIVRSDIDGSNLVELVSLGPTTALDLVLDVGAAKMYWAERDGLARIRRANIDGTNVELVYENWPVQPSNLGVDSTNGKLYWTDGNGGIMRAGLGGSLPQVVIPSGSYAGGFSLDLAAGHLYWSHGPNATPGIRRSNLDGTATVSFRTGNYSDLVAQPSLGKLYWSVRDEWSGANRRIGRTNLDASDDETVLAATTIAPSGIAISEADGRVYWSDPVLAQFLSVDLAGTGPIEPVPFLNPGASASGIAVDAANLKVYFSDLTCPGGEECHGRILRRHLTSGLSVPEVIVGDVTPPYNDEFPIYVAVDLSGGKIYWAESSTAGGSIGRANLDGTARQTLLAQVDPKPFNLALDLPAGRIYWTAVPASGDGKIQRANLDGSGVEDVLTVPAATYGLPRGIAFDAGNGKITWATDTGKLMRADLDGGNVELIASDVGAPTAIAVVSVPDAAVPTAAPAPHDVSKNRYISFTPGNGTTPVAFRVELSSSTLFPGSSGVLGWVSAPDAGGASTLAAAPVVRIWPEAVVHVGDCRVVPGSAYAVRASNDGTDLTAPLPVTTVAQPAGKHWGDAVGMFVGGSWLDPDGQVNINDAVAAIRTFQSATGAPHFTRTDLHDQAPNRVVNFTDISYFVRAFQGFAYPFAHPATCP